MLVYLFAINSFRKTFQTSINNSKFLCLKGGRPQEIYLSSRVTEKSALYVKNM